jgi:WD40 repeat protein
VWDTRTGTRVASLEGPAIILSHAAYELPDHRPRIYGGSTNGTFIIFDGDSFTKVHQGDLGGAGVRACYVYKTLGDDRPRIVSGNGDGSVTVLDGETGELVRRIEPPPAGVGNAVTTVKGFDHPWLLEHRTVAAGGGAVWVICPEGDGGIMMTLEVPDPLVFRLACFEPSHSPGRFCVAACTGRAAWVWEEGALVHRFQTEDDEDKILDMTVG